MIHDWLSTGSMLMILLTLNLLTNNKVLFGRPFPFLEVRCVSSIRVFHPWLAFEIECPREGTEGNEGLVGDRRRVRLFLASWFQVPSSIEETDCPPL